MKKTRTFISISIPDPVKSNLQSLFRYRERSPRQFRWVNPAQLHLTLKFMGDRTPAEIESIIAQLELTCRHYAPFTLALDQLGGFPNLKYPRVLWVGLKGEVEYLTQIATAIDQALEQQGFERETKPFRPHLTICRINGKQGITPVIEELKRVHLPSNPFTVNGIQVMKSELRPQGAIHTPLKYIPLPTTAR
ncbi:MAG: RNA 2',3'-cyclic phosphodiesterase [Gemmatimonadetes bacterium]|nr:MAG: RNA 2',3'-cyclic phosphodiesterase [Gemmatimonadota bacterium]